MTNQVNPPSEQDPNKEGLSNASKIGYGVVIALPVLGSLLWFFVRAESRSQLGTAKTIVVILILFVVAVIIGVASFHDNSKIEVDEARRNQNEWLLRLVLVTALGLSMVVLYATQWIESAAIPIAAIGLLTAGAAWLFATVIGFLFGFPHRDESAPKTKTKSQNALGSQRQQPAQDSQSSAPNVSNTTGTEKEEEEEDYRPSTSLDEISDWLTKIIVGVGLTELYKVPGLLDSLASYIATGMGVDAAHKPFALAIFIYFSACGFLFGFLWARLYMFEAFKRAQQSKPIR